MHKNLLSLTPVENHAGMWFKREDKFAPLGYGGINGSKCRQIIWLINRGTEHGAMVLYSGASVKSPQLSMSAIVGAHYGMATRLVLGATKPETAARHPNVQAAARFGAHFTIIPVAYNPALQRKVRDLHQSSPGSMMIEYGITLDHRKNLPEDIVAFHELGANQVRNLPDVEELIIPAGSCNTLVSVLYGIAKYRTSVQRIFTLGIGPDKLLWVHDRLRIIEQTEGIDIIPIFNRIWPQYQSLAAAYSSRFRNQIEWKHFNLQDAGFASYQDEMKETQGDIAFHGTYEGKMVRWLRQQDLWRSDNSQCFWIVGSAPDLRVLEPFCLLPHQEKIHVY